MAVANNADDYAAVRQNIWFPAHNQTPADGNLTGQCVTLDKWFMAEMAVVSNPFAARGNANTMGRTLVNQGLAFEVPYAERRRGDIICYEYGTYGHTAIQLSGGRVFESNVNWSGVATKIVDGERVYASRIGSENEAWRAGKNPHIYRLKSYVENGGKKMVNGNDITDLFVGILFRTPNAEEVRRYDGKVDGGTLARELNGCPERQALLASLIADEETIRILAVSVLKRPEPLTTTDDLRWHIGKHGAAVVKEFWYSDEGRAGNEWQQKAQKAPAPTPPAGTYEEITEPVYRKVTKEGK